MSDYANKFILFENKDPKSDKSPTHTGKLNVGGVDYEIAGWSRKAQDGSVYVSGSVKPKGSYKPSPKPVAAQKLAWTPPKPPASQRDEDVPF